MMPVDLWALGFGALWVLGLSLNLAAFSLADYHRAQTGKSLRDVWSSPAYTLTAYTGWALFCFGLLGTARSIWESLIWLSLGLIFSALALQAIRTQKSLIT